MQQATGDADKMIGRRVTLKVPIQTYVDNAAFWAAEGNGEILVVLGRDTRDAAARQRGDPSPNQLQAVNADVVTVVGTVQRLPRSEETYSWRLTAEDIAKLMKRPIYVRADGVS